MGSKHQHQEIIVVGLGPSAVGLIYGLLSPYAIVDGEDNPKSKHLGRKDDNDDLDDVRQVRKPNLSITVIERGKGHEHERATKIKDPKQWFPASHFNKSHSTQVHSVPQKGLGGRIICLPTGKGFGGGTNINACLAVRPSSDDFDDWPLQWKESVDRPTEISASYDGADNMQQLEKQNGKSHGGRMRIMNSVLEIESVLQSNNALVEPAIQIVEGFHQKAHAINPTATSGENDEGTTFQDIPIEQCHGHAKKNLSTQLQPLPMRFVARWNEKNKNYTRVNYYEGILEPFLKWNPHLREYITFRTESQVERLILKRNRNCDNESDRNKSDGVRLHENEDDWIAQGVEFVQNGECHILKADKVILCAGAIYSPALLMASGIGDPVQLRKAGIAAPGTSECKGQVEVKNGKEWCGVGGNLRDHMVMIRLFFTSPFATFFQGRSVNAVRGWIPLDVEMKGIDKCKDGKERPRKARVSFSIFDGSGFHYMIPYAGACTFHRQVDLSHLRIPGISTVTTLILKCISNLLYFILNMLMWIYPLAWLINRCSAIILFALLDPKSCGRIWAERRKSCAGIQACRMSEVDIFVDPAYLMNDRDLEEVESGWKVLDGLAPQIFPGALEVLPGVLFPDRSRFAADLSLPYFHFSGSCSMETSTTKNSRSSGHGDLESDFVVDKDLKLRNVKGLHVCDASILPTNVSSNPSLLLAAVGLTSASFITRQVGGTSEENKSRSVVSTKQDTEQIVNPKGKMKLH